MRTFDSDLSLTLSSVICSSVLNFLRNKKKGISLVVSLWPVKWIWDNSLETNGPLLFLRGPYKDPFLSLFWQSLHCLSHQYRLFELIGTAAKESCCKIIWILHVDKPKQAPYRSEIRWTTQKSSCQEKDFPYSLIPCYFHVAHLDDLPLQISLSLGWVIAG